MDLQDKDRMSQEEIDFLIERFGVRDYRRESQQPDSKDVQNLLHLQPSDSSQDSGSQTSQSWVFRRRSLVCLVLRVVVADWLQALAGKIRP